MKVLYVPQINDFHTLSHSFNGEVITFIVDGIEDVYDFTGLPDGILDMESYAEIVPIKSAKRVNGILEVVILHIVKENAAEEEKFPVWIEVG